MKTLITVLVLFIALEHLYFLVLEMFLWTKPKGIKTFGLKSKEFAEDTKVLAANQGLYNGFLTAGLVVSLILESQNFIIFFLSCVAIAGIYGAQLTGNRRLFYIQGLPAIITLVLVIIT